MSDHLIWGIGLMAGALMLFLLEVFIPSGGVIGFTAFAVAVAGVVAFWMEGSAWGVASTIGLIVLVPLAFNFALRIMPNTPFGRRLILGDDEDEALLAQRAAAESERRERERALVGAEGVVLTDLRPVGSAKIEGQRLEVLAETGVIEAGARIRVTKVEGTQVKVRAI
ncbi:MAG: NfeD family protein [Phycisphaerales bacterium]|nr:NfeD family protein [Phycisphaerales bacterium]